MSREQGAAVAGAFWALAPVVAIASSWEGRANAQIAVTVVTSSIVHSAPRLLVGIWKGNYTHELIVKSHAFTVHLLRREQLGVVRRFGFYTGRDGDKLRGAPYKTGSTGSPVLEDVHSHAECRVLNAMDGGDMTAFLSEVVDGGINSRGGDWMTLSHFYSEAPPEWIEEYGQKLARSVAFSLERIHRISYEAWKP
ncbi:MAG: flavin reductase family protein [Deltaproteobacteria bacterium]